jgi:hypothetical protein
MLPCIKVREKARVIEKITSLEIYHVDPEKRFTRVERE